MAGPLVLVAVLSLPALFVLVARPVQRRLALRYPARRPVEAALVVLGTLLGTSIITGSLIVGDTIDRSITASAYDQLGPIDELVTVSGLAEGEALAARFDGFTAPDLDGVLSFVTAPVAVAGEATQPRAQIVEVDFETAAAFGGDASLTGISGPTPGPGRAVITDDLAARAQVAPGDTVSVFAYGQQLPLVVDRVVPRTGVAGFWPIDNRQQSYNVLVAPGTVEQLLAAAGPAAALSEPPAVQIAFSNAGGVEEGASTTDSVTADVEAVLGETDAVVRPVKRDLLDAATEAASSLTQLYFTMGMFAVAAGVLLVVNIFVMLADERRSELGMLRAIGLRRLPLVGAFTTEGWIYSLTAGILGALLGHRVRVGHRLAGVADPRVGQRPALVVAHLLVRLVDGRARLRHRIRHLARHDRGHQHPDQSGQRHRRHPRPPRRAGAGDGEALAVDRCVDRPARCCSGRRSACRATRCTASRWARCSRWSDWGRCSPAGSAPGRPPRSWRSWSSCGVRRSSRFSAPSTSTSRSRCSWCRASRWRPPAWRCSRSTKG